MTLPVITEIPEWLIVSNPNGRLNSKDMARLLGYSTKTNSLRSMRKGNGPAPEPELYRGRYMWRVGDVRNWIRANKESLK